MSGRVGIWGVVAASLAICVPLDASIAAEPACTVEKFVELPVTMAGRRPVIRAKINGAEQLFLADSGAIVSMIAPDVVARLKLPTRPAPPGMAIGGVGGALNVRLATVKSFELAGRTAADVDFLVGGDAAGVPGIIGQNMLAMADTQYDLAAGMIRLVRASPCGERAAVAWAAGQPYAEIAIDPLRGNQRHVVGAGSLNGVSLRVLFDTGSPTSLLSLSAAARAGLHPGQPGVIPAGKTNGLGGAIAESWLAPSASYSLGGQDIRGDALRIADMGNVPFDLLIGSDFFLGHRLYVAHSRNRLYFAAIGTGSLPSLANAAAYGKRGAEFLAKGDLPNAIADYSRAIEMAPNDPRYLIQRSKARLASGHDLLARQDVDQAIAMRPAMAEARLGRAAMLAGGKEVATVKEDLAAGSAALPVDDDQRLFIASIYAGIEDWQNSREQFDQWASYHAADPRLPVALNASCWAGAMLNRELSRALADCNTALAKAPASFETGDSRGLVWLRMGRFKEAIADYDAVLARQPDFPWSLFGRGLAKLRTGRTDEGRADIASALRIDPQIANKAARIGLIGSAADPQ